MYADNVQLHLSSPVLYMAVNVNRLNDDLERIYHWANGKWPLFKPSKYLVIRRRTLDFNIGFDTLMNEGEDQDCRCFMNFFQALE